MKSRLAERITDVYLITMLLVFPLFFGFSGYSNITLSKFVFLLAATGLWLAALGVAALLGYVERPGGSHALWAAAGAVFCALLSWLFCGDLAQSFWGAGRYDGLLVTLVYAFIFAGVSCFSRPKLLHVRALGLAVCLCLLVALLQLCGFNPLRLYPGDYRFYDHGIRYSGVYLGTIGNTNILDAVLCLALPVFVGLYVTDARREMLIPAALAVPVLCKACGDGGRLALAAALLVGPVLVLTELGRIRRALLCMALLLALAAASICWQPQPGAALLFRFSRGAAFLLAAAAVCAALSRLPLPASFAPSPRALRIVFGCFAGGCVCAGLVAVLAFPGDSGTLYELNRLLHGQAEDGFGSSRIGIWRACLALFRRRPLLGQGPGMLAAGLDIQYERYVPETGQTLRSFADNAHNVYLAALCNTGLPGLAALLAELAAVAECAVRRRRDPLFLSLALGVGCAAVHGLFGLGLCLSQPLFWLLAGLICAQRPDEEKP